MRFTLASDVHLTLSDGDVVLLDARTDRYACLPRCDAAAIRTGATARVWDDGPLVCELAAAGYMTVAAERVQPGEPPPPLPETDFYLSDTAPAAIAPATLLDVAASGFIAAWRLRTQQPRHWLHRRASTNDDPARCIMLARRFAAARLCVPLLGRCLPHSLALDHYLRRHHCPAQLIFGVRTHPFEAHCWMQSGLVVLNDTACRARWFTPIAWS